VLTHTREGNSTVLPKGEFEVFYDSSYDFDLGHEPYSSNEGFVFRKIED
jgi:hypothetical protein